MATVSLKNEYRFSARIDTPRTDEFIKTRLAPVGDYLFAVSYVLKVFDKV